MQDPAAAAKKTMLPTSSLRAAIRRERATASGRLSLHSLRHAYPSRLIANRLNVVFVSRQLAHANPNITLEVYAQLSPAPTTPRPPATRSKPATPQTISHA
jgi:integrase